MPTSCTTRHHHRHGTWTSLPFSLSAASVSGHMCSTTRHASFILLPLPTARLRHVLTTTQRLLNCYIHLPLKRHLYICTHNDLPPRDLRLQPLPASLLLWCLTTFEFREPGGRRARGPRRPSVLAGVTLSPSEHGPLWHITPPKYIITEYSR